jgi:VWFA-related protein
LTRGPLVPGVLRPGAILFAFLIAVTATAQEEAVSERAFFAPVEVPLVNVEVYAADRDGRPIPGLSSSDFELFEDGEPVAISHFFASPAVAVAGPTTTIPVLDVGPKISQDLYLIIFVDESNLSETNRHDACDRLRGFLTELPPGSKVMVESHGGTTRMRQDFTDDIALTAASLERLRSGGGKSLQSDRDLIRAEMQTLAAQTWREGGALPTDRSLRPLEMSDYGSRSPMNYLQNVRAYSQEASVRTELTLEALERLVRSVAGIRGRKAVFLVSDGIEVAPGAELFRAWQQIFAEVMRATAINPTSEAQRYDVSDSIEDLIEHANTHRVTIHALGSTGERAFSSVRADQEGGVTLTAGLDSGQRFKAGRGEAIMAEATGGQSFIINRRLPAELSELAVELGSYYSMAYRPPSPSDGRYHKIEVRVAEQDMTLRHRKGYRALRDRDRISDTTLAAAAFGVTDNPLEVSAESQEQQMRPDGQFLVPIVVRVPFAQLSLLPQTAEHEGRVTITVAVKDEFGALSKVQRRVYPVKIPHDQFLSALSQNAEFIMGLIMKPGSQRVAVGVRDELGNVDSTVTVDVNVGRLDL